MASCCSAFRLPVSPFRFSSTSVTNHHTGGNARTLSIDGSGCQQAGAKDHEKYQHFLRINSRGDRDGEPGSLCGALSVISCGVFQSFTCRARPLNVRTSLSLLGLKSRCSAETTAQSKAMASKLDLILISLKSCRCGA